MESIFTSQHNICKRNWKGRILDALFSDYTRKALRITGAYMVYFTCLYHFDIKFNVWESLLIGFGLGLYIE